MSLRPESESARDTERAMPREIVEAIALGGPSG
jgi:hypothetical protein